MKYMEHLILKNRITIFVNLILEKVNQSPLIALLKNHQMAFSR